MGVTRIESNRNRHFGLKIESKSIENRNLEIVTSLYPLLPPEREHCYTQSLHQRSHNFQLSDSTSVLKDKTLSSECCIVVIPFIDNSILAIIIPRVTVFHLFF